MLLNDDDYDREERLIVIHQARNVISWSGTRGFLGLAARGPETGSKLGSTAPGRVELHGVTSVSDVAARAWKAALSWE